MEAKLVKSEVRANGLKFLAQVPLWAVYSVTIALGQDQEIIAHMAGEDDLPMVSLYVRKAA